jgi:hypothetical protein
MICVQAQRGRETRETTVVAATSPLDEYGNSQELTFDGVLAVMLGLIGRVVSIGVSAAEDTPPLTLTAVGLLERGTAINLSVESGGDQEEFLFLLGEENPEPAAVQSLFLLRPAYRAGRVEDGVLWIQLGPLQLTIEVVQ